MADEVKTVARRIVDRDAGQIGTHTAMCHEYHLVCFAAFVLRELEAGDD